MATTADTFILTLGVLGGSGNPYSLSISGNYSGLTEGYNYATLAGKTQTGTAGTWHGLDSASTSKIGLHINSHGRK